MRKPMRLHIRRALFAAAAAFMLPAAAQPLPPLKPPAAAPQLQTPQLKPATAGYSAMAANAGYQGSANAGGVAWQCAAGRCTASGPATPPTVQACSELARTVGTLRSFAYGQSALGPNELGQCNAVVAQPAIKPAVPIAPSSAMPDLKPTQPLQSPTLQAAPTTVTPSGTIRLPPVNITTGTLMFTGSRFESVNLTTGALLFTGSRFETVNLTTGALLFTGNRFESVNLTTGTLLFTGNRFETVNLTTGTLMFTGSRFETINLTTGTLSFTGSR